MADESRVPSRAAASSDSSSEHALAGDDDAVVRKKARLQKTQGGAGRLKRNVTRRGAWTRMPDDKVQSLTRIFENFAGFLAPLVLLRPAVDEKARKVAELEAAHAEVLLIMVRC